MNSLENTGTLGNPPVSDDVKTSPETDSGLWTTERVAQYLHVSLKTVFNLRKKGLPYVQLGGAVRFVPQEIKDYLVTNRGLTAHRLRQVVAERSRQMIMPRHAPPGAYVDDPAEKLDRPASEQPSVFTLASHGMTRIKEWAARGKAKQRALRHDLVTALSLCPEMLPCKHPSPTTTMESLL